MDARAHRGDPRHAPANTRPQRARRRPTARTERAGSCSCCAPCDKGSGSAKHARNGWSRPGQHSITACSHVMRDHRESTRAQVRSTLEHALAQAQTTEIATAIVQRMIELTGQDSEADRTERARHELTPSLDRTARVANAESEIEQLATLLVEIAMRALAGGKNGKEVAEAAWEVFAPGKSD